MYLDKGQLFHLLNLIYFHMCGQHIVEEFEEYEVLEKTHFYDLPDAVDLTGIDKQSPN